MAFSPFEFLKTQPWWIFVLLALAYWLGQAIADFRNDASWMRAWLRDRTRLISTHRVFIETKAGSTAIVLWLKSAKRISNATILLHIYGFGEKTIIVDRNIEVANGEELQYILAELLDDNNAGRWVPNGSETYIIQKSFKYIAVIELIAARWTPKQRIKILIDLNTARANDKTPIAIIEETSDVFDEHSIQNFTGSFLA